MMTDGGRQTTQRRCESGVKKVKRFGEAGETLNLIEDVG